MEPVAYILVSSVILSLLAYTYLQHKSIKGWEARCAEQSSTLFINRKELDRISKEYSDYRKEYYYSESAIKGGEKIREETKKELRAAQLDNEFLRATLAAYQFPEITTKPHWDEQDEAAAAAFFRGPVGSRLIQSLEFEAHAINAKTVQQRDNVERHCGAACGWASAVAYIKQNSGCHRPPNGETDSDGTKPEIPTAELYRA